MDRAKRLAAAMAAVSAYIQAEEEELAKTSRTRSPAWSMFGRQAQAQQCSLMQARARR